MELVSYCNQGVSPALGLDVFLAGDELEGIELGQDHSGRWPATAPALANRGEEAGGWRKGGRRKSRIDYSTLRPSHYLFICFHAL